MSAQPALSCTTWTWDATIGDVTVINSHTILTAATPEGQYTWDQPTPSAGSEVFRIYEQSIANSGFLAFLNGNRWYPDIHNYQDNGLNLQLDGPFDNVNEFILLNDVNFTSGPNDGIKSFTVKLYTPNNALLGTHSFTAANQQVVQVFNLGTTYNNVASFDLIVNDVYIRSPIQIREVALGSTTGLSCAPPPPLSLLNVTKTASAAGFVTGNVQQAPVGTVVTYTYVITNVGDTTLSGIAINDVHNGENTPPNPNIETASLTDNGSAGDSSEAVSDGVWDTLGPGDSLTITSTYTISQPDIELHQ